MEERRGYVSHIVYRNVENGYTVFELENPDEDVEETCVGNVPFLNEGEYVCVRGELVTHPIYQEQLKVMSCEVQEPDDELQFPSSLRKKEKCAEPCFSYRSMEFQMHLP